MTTPAPTPATTTRNKSSRWPLERVLFAMAGTMAVGSAVLTATVSPWFLVLTVFVGLNQWLYAAVSACPASVVLHRLGVKPRCEKES